MYIFIVMLVYYFYSYVYVFYFCCYVYVFLLFCVFCSVYSVFICQVALFGYPD